MWNNQPQILHKRIVWITPKPAESAASSLTTRCQNFHHTIPAMHENYGCCQNYFAHVQMTFLAQYETNMFKKQKGLHYISETILNILSHDLDEKIMKTNQK